MVCGDLNWKEIQKSGDEYIHIANSHYCTVGTNTTLLANYTPIQIKKKKQKNKRITNYHLTQQLSSWLYTQEIQKHTFIQ